MSGDSSPFLIRVLQTINAPAMGRSAVVIYRKQPAISRIRIVMKLLPPFDFIGGLCRVGGMVVKEKIRFLLAILFAFVHADAVGASLRKYGGVYDQKTGKTTFFDAPKVPGIDNADDKKLSVKMPEDYTAYLTPAKIRTFCDSARHNTAVKLNILMTTQECVSESIQDGEWKSMQRWCNFYGKLKKNILQDNDEWYYNRSGGQKEFVPGDIWYKGFGVWQNNPEEFMPGLIWNAEFGAWKNNPECVCKGENPPKYFTDKEKEQTAQGEHPMQKLYFGDTGIKEYLRFKNRTINPSGGEKEVTVEQLNICINLDCEHEDANWVAEQILECGEAWTSSGIKDRMDIFENIRKGNFQPIMLDFIPDICTRYDKNGDNVFHILIKTKNGDDLKSIVDFENCSYVKNEKFCKMFFFAKDKDGKSANDLAREYGDETYDYLKRMFVRQMEKDEAAMKIPECVQAIEMYYEGRL